MSSSEKNAREGNRQHYKDLEQESAHQAHLESEPNPPLSGPDRPRVLEDTPAVPVQPSTPDVEEPDRMRMQGQILLQQRREQVGAEQDLLLKARDTVASTSAPAAPTVAMLLSAKITMVQQILALEADENRRFRRNEGRQPTPQPVEKDTKFIEWFSNAAMHASHDGTDDQEWINILNDVRSQPGCDALAQSDVENSPSSKVIAIEWVDALSLVNFYATECSKQFMHGLTKHGLDSRPTFAMCLSGVPRRIIFPGASNGNTGGEVYEVCTLYFRGLSASDLEAIKWIYAAFENPRDYPNLSDTFNGALSRSRGWAEGEVTYRGQAARRLVFILRWEDKQAQERYKAEVMWPTLTRDGRKVLGPVDSFVYELEDRGLLGFESQDFHFQASKYYNALSCNKAI